MPPEPAIKPVNLSGHPYRLQNTFLNRAVKKESACYWNQRSQKAGFRSDFRSDADRTIGLQRSESPGTEGRQYEATSKQKVAGGGEKQDSKSNGNEYRHHHERVGTT